MTITEIKEILKALNMQCDIAGLSKDSKYRKHTNNFSRFFEEKLDSENALTDEDYLKIITAFSQIRSKMTELDSTTNESDSKSKGADENLAQLEGIVASIDVSKGWSLKTHIERYNSNIIDVSKTPDAMGASSSQRYLIKMPNPDGTATEGFFTKEGLVFDLDKNNRVRKIVEETMKSLDDSGEFGDTVCYGYCKNLLESKYGVNSLIMCINFKDGIKDKANKSGLTSDNLGSMYENRIFSDLKPFGNKVPELGDMPKNPKLYDMLKRIRYVYEYEEAKSIRRIYVQYTDKYGVNADTNSKLASRNVAMSCVANVLGVSNVIAKSENVTVNMNGEHIKGVFTENAKGLVPPSVNHDGQFLNTNFMKLTSASMDGACLKSIAELQIIDYICSNVDRHMNNIAYNIDDSGKLLGVQGFDNDNSFGTAIGDSYVQKLQFSVALGEITVISRRMADSILLLEPNTLKAALDGNGLGEKEIEACLKRFNQVKTEVSKGFERQKKRDRQRNGIGLGAIKIVEDSEWEKYTIDRLANMDLYKGKNPDQVNLFGMVRSMREYIPKLKRAVLRGHIEREESQPLSFVSGKVANETTEAEFAKKIKRISDLKEALVKCENAEHNVNNAEYKKLVEALTQACDFEPNAIFDDAQRHNFEYKLGVVKDAAEDYVYQIEKAQKNAVDRAERERFGASLKVANNAMNYVTQEIPNFHDIALSQEEIELEEYAKAIREEQKMVDEIVSTLSSANPGKAIEEGVALRFLLGDDQGSIRKYAKMAKEEPDNLVQEFKKIDDKCENIIHTLMEQIVEKNNLTIEKAIDAEKLVRQNSALRTLFGDKKSKLQRLELQARTFPDELYRDFMALQPDRKNPENKKLSQSKQGEKVEEVKKVKKEDKQISNPSVVGPNV